MDKISATGEKGRNFEHKTMYALEHNASMGKPNTGQFLSFPVPRSVFAHGAPGLPFVSYRNPLSKSMRLIL